MSPHTLFYGGGEVNIPGWLQEHPALVRRGVILDNVLKQVSRRCSLARFVHSCAHFQDCVYCTEPAILSILQHVVKIVPEDSAENYIYPYLFSDINSNSSNHTLPCEVIKSNSNSTVLVMPFVRSALCPMDSVSDFCDCVSQVLEVCRLFHSQPVLFACTKTMCLGA